jgi:GT2 family glycosyltransferase
VTSIGPRPTVSVVVPCYKYGQYVQQTVTSILRNERVDIDVLVIDDCSPDDSWEVVQALPRFDTRVRVVRNERNQGLIATANDGLDQAKGDYVVLLSADDALAPGWLDRGVDLLERTPHATFVKGPVRVFEGPHLPTLRKQRDLRSVVWPGRDWIAKSCDQGVTDVRSPEVIVRTSAQRQAGGYNPKVPYSSDMEMWLRLASLGDVIEVTGPVSAFYRFHPSNMSRGKDLLGVGELDSNDDAFDEWYAGAGSRVEGADELLKRAHRALAVMAVARAPRAFLEDPPMFQRLCEFALEKDLLWAAPQVAKLRQRLTSPLAVRARDRLTPLTEAVVQTRRKVPHLRARAGAYTAWVNDRLGTADHDATGTKARHMNGEGR